LGPIKVECADVTITSDGDTFASKLQRPLWALFLENTDGNTTVNGINAAVSGKVITFNHSGISSTRGTVIIVGF
jgi:hypothetical protein